MTEIRLKISLPFLLVASAAAAYATKPEESTFRPFFKSWMQEELKRKRQSERQDESGVFGISQWIGEAAENMVSTVVSRFSTPEFKDYQVCRVARLRSHGKDFYFFGIYGRWVALTSAQKLLDQFESS